MIGIRTAGSRAQSVAALIMLMKAIVMITERNGGWTYSLSAVTAGIGPIHTGAWKRPGRNGTTNTGRKGYSTCYIREQEEM